MLGTRARQLRLLVVEGAECGVFEEGVAEFVEGCEKVELGGGVGNRGRRSSSSSSSSTWSHISHT